MMDTTVVYAGAWKSTRWYIPGRVVLADGSVYLCTATNLNQEPPDTAYWQPLAGEGVPGSYTDEDAQDAVGTILTDSSTVDFTYTDATPAITAAVKDGSLGTAKLSFDVATQAELDAHTGDTSNAHAASAVGFTPVGTIAATDTQAAVAEVATDAASALSSHEADTTAIHGIADTSVLATASSVATAVSNHEADTTAVHGIADTANLVLTGDARLSDSRAPNGAAGGVLSGTYPNPGFAADMATQAELDAKVSDTAYDATSWNGVTTVAPSKNAVRDQVEVLAPLASPTFTGTPAAPSAAQGTNTTQLATTAYVQTEAGLLVPKTRSVISGAGLTGGGDLTADRTLAVGAGAGIIANADDVAVNFGTIFKVASVTGDHSTSSQVLSDVAGLAAFSTVAGATYWFRFDLMVTTNATTVGILCSVNHSTAVTSIRYVQEYPTAATTWTTEQVTALQGGTLPTAGPGAALTRYTIVGQVVINTAGTLALQSRSETATATVVKAGSVGVLIRTA